MDDEKWDGTTWAGDVHNGEGVYSVNLHESGLNQVKAVVANYLEWTWRFMFLQTVIIMTLLVLLLA
jgi:hypothetical protein